ncbi:prephenate dehydrogenase [Kineosporia sp. R_H_3]|uniref:prephenate dehydrogenase n=1 Tax=Kineosporia sp. R_H_3 TaxID=1961848 RepID=UPI000B4A5FBB|nr:prephenate dehydrogenase [Kineosporia sp. R_H_3]
MSLDAAVAAGLPTVKVVGTGLLGTSVGLGLASGGARVLLSDPSPTALALARDLGAGTAAAGGDGADVGLVVVAAPPDVTADVVLAELAAHPAATVTDVASVKSGILAEVAARGGDLSRYVGGHPMAGRERSGPVAARGDLFIGRPWVVCAGEKADGDRVDLVRRLALALGATPVVMGAEEHDASVAVVSHVPQVAASLVAARLRTAPEGAVGLAGQGLRDVTRIAGSDPLLWAQILSANAAPVLDVLTALRADLDGVIAGLASIAAEGGPGDGAPPALGARAAVAKVVADGNVGRERIPGKHGGQATRYAVVTVVVPDAPGSLARLFADIGDAGVNVEELALEHAPGRAVGLVEVSVLPAVRERLEAALDAAGWKVVA